MPPREEWRRYVAPAAFLLGVTIFVIVIRAGLESGSSTSGSTPVIATTTHKVVTTTAPRTKTTKKGSSSAKAYWTVKAGDTFGVISSQTGVPVATLEQLNPNVSSTSLFIGEKLRIK